MLLSHLFKSDPSVFNSVQSELERQQTQIELIASENIVSRAVLEAQGSVLTNKYAEGYPGRRYYGGCDMVDLVETIAINRLKQIFNCAYANVQPHSGAQANQAAMLALIRPGDTILGMDLSAGGHLTHGASVTLSGKWFHAVRYGVDPQNHLIDYDQVEALALEHQPKLIIAGASSYPRVIDFSRFRQIADKVGAYLLADIAHYAGLIAAGIYPSPLEYAHVVTSTTHKTLRGPRGGIILSNDMDLGKKINSAVFPGLQGGPLMHVIAAKAVAFGEILQPEFKSYAQNVLDNARAMAHVLLERGLALISGGTDSHMLIIDLRPVGVTGRDGCDVLEKAHMTVNKNGIPFDPQPPTISSGIRIGTPAITTRGFGSSECAHVAHLMVDVLEALRDGRLEEVIPVVKAQALELCQRFPIYV